MVGITEKIKKEVVLIDKFLNNCKQSGRGFSITLSGNAITSSTNYYHGKDVTICNPFSGVEAIFVFQNGQDTFILLQKIDTIIHFLNENNKIYFYIEFKDKKGWAIIKEE